MNTSDQIEIKNLLRGAKDLKENNDNAEKKYVDEKYVSTVRIKFQGDTELKFELCVNCAVDLRNHVKKFLKEEANDEDM